MKAINSQKPMTKIAAPKGTPRISRQRIWQDKSEWRKSAIATGEASQLMIDRQLENARNVGELEKQDYLDLADLTDRAGRIGINKS